MEIRKKNRYFVTVFAKDAAQLRSLADYDFDLFGHTDQKLDEDQDFTCCIDGLLAMDQIDLLVRKGYQVRIRASARQLESRPVEIISPETWLREAARNFTETHLKTK